MVAHWVKNDFSLYEDVKTSAPFSQSFYSNFNLLPEIANNVIEDNTRSSWQVMPRTANDLKIICTPLTSLDIHFLYVFACVVASLITNHPPRIVHSFWVWYTSIFVLPDFNLGDCNGCRSAC